MREVAVMGKQLEEMVDTMAQRRHGRNKHHTLPLSGVAGDEVVLLALEHIELKYVFTLICFQKCNTHKTHMGMR